MSDTALQQLLCHLGDAEREMLLERQRAQNWVGGSAIACVCTSHCSASGCWNGKGLRTELGGWIGLYICLSACGCSSLHDVVLVCSACM
jgi:hypothetical protein